jgi:hypothetical protein
MQQQTAAVSANPTADRTYLGALGNVLQRAATRGDDNEVAAAFRTLEDLLRRRAQQPAAAMPPELACEPFNASQADINSAWGRQ